MKLGVGILVAAMALTPLTDGFSKALATDQSPYFIVFSRYFVAGIIALGISVIFRKPIEIPVHDRVGQVFRTGLMMSAMTALIFALSIVPLAKAVGGFLIAPVVASLISVMLYKEKMDIFRFTGAGLSFAGAYVILRPEGSLELGTLLALLGGVLLGAYLAATRRACACGDAFSTLVVQCIVGSLMLAPLAFWNGIPDISLQNLIFIVALGAVSAICHFLTVAAYNRAESSVLAPFFYFNIVFAIPVGYFWFNELPTQATLIGLAGITLGGVIAMLSANAQLNSFKGILANPWKFVKSFSLKI
ncbi:MAG: DMT family transporter [Rhodobacteraceae bacterium]|nr:DMT family transporter [Paracoccaceae bacterium]